MINCVLGVVPSARRNVSDVQLMCDAENRTILGVKMSTFSRITNFTNCFVQYSHTGVGERRAILTAIFWNQTSRKNTCKTSRSYSLCITAVKIVKCNYDSHYYLANTRKSEMSVSISEQLKNNYYSKFEKYIFHTKLQGGETNDAESYAYCNFYDFNNKTTTSLKTQGENAIFYKMISGITKIFFLQRPHYFFKILFEF